MKKKMITLTLITLAFNISCMAQTQQQREFNRVTKLFPELKVPSKYKDGERGGNDIKDVNKVDAIKYLHFTEDDLKMNDYKYNHDEDIRTDNWVEVLPGALNKISKGNYIALVYALLKSPTHHNDIVYTYTVTLTTFTYEGSIIDSIVVRSKYTPDTDWKDVVFLENNVLQIFDYKPNLENYNIKGGTYYIIDKKGPKTVVEINDYQIEGNGKIKHIKTYPKQYLQEFVDFYQDYHEDSDDPMNEYDFE
ncbi:MAG: hypothetical protein LBL13_10575 [Bacteroidales bacterium]|jgi:hypothetical protein|nr:hypothetical protein [Bacteroidales bacterium]